jgi:hypothetical protein
MALKVATLDETARYGARGVRKLFGRLPRIGGAGEPGTGVVLNVAAVSTTSTAKTVIAYQSSANTPVNLVELGVSADGTSGNLLVELCWSTAATAGTAGTAPTSQQIRGPAGTLNATVTGNYSAEPTVLTRVKAWRFPLPGGPFVIQSPLGREPNSITAASTAGKQVCLRLTASVTCNTDSYVEIEE